MLIDLNMKQKELAVLTDMTEANLSRIMNGQNVKLQTLGDICKALQCQPADLIIYDPQPA